MEGTVFASALEGFKTVKSEQGEILTKPFLDVCKQILPVIGSLAVCIAYMGIEDVTELMRVKPSSHRKDFTLPRSQSPINLDLKILVGFFSNLGMNHRHPFEKLFQAFSDSM